MKVSVLIEKLKNYNQDADVFIQWPDTDNEDKPTWSLDSVDYIMSDITKDYKDVDKVVFCPLAEDDMNKWNTLVEENYEGVE